MASGFMTGKFVKGDHAGTRFADNNPLGKFAQKLFAADSLHAAFDKFDNAVAGRDLTTLEVSIRWIFHHSALDDNDGVVVGASKERQIEEVVAMVQQGPLPADVVRLAEQLWEELADSRSQII